MTDHEMAKQGRGRAPGATNQPFNGPWEQMRAGARYLLTDLRDAEDLKSRPAIRISHG